MPGQNSQESRLSGAMRAFRNAARNPFTEPIARRAVGQGGVGEGAKLVVKTSVIATLLAAGLEACTSSEKGNVFTPEQFFAVAFRNGGDMPDFSADNGGFPAGEGIVINGVMAEYAGKKDEMIAGWGSNFLDGTDRYKLHDPSTSKTVDIHDNKGYIGLIIAGFGDIQQGTYNVNVVLAVGQTLTDDGGAVDANNHPILQLNVKAAQKDAY